MAAAGGARSFAAMTLPRLLTALGALYLTGIVLALAGDLAPLGTAIASGSELNAPLPIIAAQLLGGLLLLRGHRAGGVLLLAACTLSLAAVAFDGDLGAQGLAPAQVAYQLAITTVTAATWFAGLRATATRRPAPGASSPRRSLRAPAR
jgi:hypothetical protein